MPLVTAVVLSRVVWYNGDAMWMATMQENCKGGHFIQMGLI